MERTRTRPRPTGETFPCAIPPIVHACPYCHTPAFVGALGPGSRVEVKCKHRDCRGFTVPFQLPAPVAGAARLPVADKYHRCVNEACNKPFCRGHLAPGTKLEVVCRRRDCRHNQDDRPFRIVVV